MMVRFWGTRGSIPTPGPETIKYGGNTPCVEVRSASQLIILDAGSGIRPLGHNILKHARGRPVKASILISHTHWDHIQGFPFFAPAYIDGNEFTIYGCEGARKRLRDIWADQMRSEYFPVPLELMASKLEFVELTDGDVFEIGDVQVKTKAMNHPGLCLGYRLSSEGKSVVYATDNEPYRHLLGASAWGGEQPDTSLVSELDQALVTFAEGADLLVHDAQFTPDEYEKHTGWGHSFTSFVVQTAEEAKVGQLALFHHDPAHSDDKVDAMVKDCRRMLRAAGRSIPCFGAREGAKIVL